jgi:inorganic pyrophosphatase
MTRLLVLLVTFSTYILAGVPLRAIVGGAPVAATAIAIDGDTIVGPRHYARGYPADDADGVYAVIEIPAGTTAKFEVTEPEGKIQWKRDREHGGRREIDYLPFLVNYGMVPRTLAPDGDPLDIVVLGRGIERGHVARTRVIGVLEMLDSDGDVRDDKLIAVPLEPALRNGFSRLHDLPELDAYYADVRTILWIWFQSYWGRGVTRLVGWGDAATAAAILEDAKRAFDEAEPGTRMPTGALLARPDGSPRKNRSRSRVSPLRSRRRQRHAPQELFILQRLGHSPRSRVDRRGLVGGHDATQQVEAGDAQADEATITCRVDAAESQLPRVATVAELPRAIGEADRALCRDISDG